MIPRLSVGVIVLVIIAYVLGARYPALASKIGLA